MAEARRKLDADLKRVVVCLMCGRYPEAGRPVPRTCARCGGTWITEEYEPRYG